MKTLLIMLLGLSMLGCSKVDKYGITDQIVIRNFDGKSACYEHLRDSLRIICLKNGYKNVLLQLGSHRKNVHGNIDCKGVGKCIK